MAKPLYVAVSTQKGGAGKTTLTAVLASFLYFIRGIDLIAIDCDYPQNNLADLRDRDFILAEKSRKVNEIVFRTWKARNGCAYDIVRSTPEDALAVAESYAAMENPPRIIFFDLPGTVNNNYVINTISQMDYVFCPITTDPMVMETSVAFANIVHNTLITTAKSKIKGFYMLWNKVPTRERSDLQCLCEQFIGTLGIPVMETVLPDSTKFHKEGQGEKRFSVFRSTILPPDKASLKGSGIEEVVNEIMGIMGI
ncbi:MULTISPECIES: ParA family protein [Muribaculaceae]|jgi:cellulose biosynthesis protein BcsQ|uniref:ParA family protein n=1 Tax=Muribaculaceae TaxID=2005473 RepID=UPI002647F998|nr:MULTISPECIES: ParA family protein [Muribaculaceae]